MELKAKSIVAAAPEPVLAVSVCPSAFNMVAVTRGQYTVIYHAEGANMRPVYKHKLPEPTAPETTCVRTCIDAAGSWCVDAEVAPCTTRGTSRRS